MTKGFYNLTSGMLSQSRRLDVVSNNMTNLTTPGYKAEQYTDSTFQEVLISRIGNKNKSGAQEIGEESYILAPSQLYINFAQGEGFFAIQTENGTEYTRGGSFALDQEGYLSLPAHGRVLGPDGQPLQLTTDDIRADEFGRIYTEDGDAYLGQIGVFAFADNGQLTKNESGLFGAGGQAAEPVQPSIQWRWVESSNVDMIREMSTMMTAERALQSAAQVLKLYDGLLTKAANELARM